MVNHGLSTGALFLLVGMVYERTHTRELAEMGGLAASMPWLAGAFLFDGVLARIGLPGLNNFVGEFLVILGHVRSSNRAVRRRWPSAGVVLARDLPAVVLPAGGATGEPRASTAGSRTSRVREVAILAPVLALLLVFGAVPKLLHRADRPHDAPPSSSTFEPVTARGSSRPRRAGGGGAVIARRDLDVRRRCCRS